MIISNSKIQIETNVKTFNIVLIPDVETTGLNCTIMIKYVTYHNDTRRISYGN